MKKLIKKNKWLLLLSVLVILHGGAINVAVVREPLRTNNWQWIDG